MKKIICILLTLTLLVPSMGLAQEGEAETEDDLIKSTQNDVLLVAVAAGAGAILGLSTLSFVDKPSKHVANIWTGAALGVIAGVIFVAYNSAQKNSEDLQSSSEFNSSERVAWHSQNAENLTFPEVTFGTTFWQTTF